MSLKKDIISAEVQIGSNEAQANLTKLAEHTARLTNENDRLRISQAKLRALGKQNGDEYKQLTAKIKENNSVIKTNKSQMDALRKTLGLTEMSSRQLRARARQLRSELSGMTKAANPAEWDRLNRDLIATERQLKKVRSQVGETTGFVKRLNKAARGLLPAFGFAAVLAGLKRITQTADQRFQSFEERVDNLSALTGLEGEQLEWLQKVAKDTSVATVEGNIRIKQSADSIIDAYTKVGSKRPELLKVKEDLAGVTQEAIILSEAAKTNLEPAVAGLTMALNQFDLGADQSRRIINTLAAGSKEGAGNIPYLTDAMEKSGTTAKLMGLNIEQWAGAIEGVAPYYEEASMAGNSFDKVLLKLKAKQIGYVNGVFDLNAAIDQLKNMYASGTSSADVFGEEHAKMGELLVKEQDKIKNYTKAVTGSNTAIEQASKNTNNEAAKRAQAQNKLNLLYIEFGEKVAPIITKGISSSIELLNVIIKYKGIIIALTTAVASFVAIKKLSVFWTTAQKSASLAAAAAQALLSGNITRAAAAMKMFNAVTKLNPFVLIASLAIAAGAAIFAFSKKTKQATAETKALLDVEAKAQESIVEEKVKLEQLLRTARDEKRSKEDRQKAIKELNEISPEYLGGLTLEKINTEEAITATDNYIEALQKKARYEAGYNQLVEIERERMEATMTGADRELSFMEKVWNARKVILTAGLSQKAMMSAYDATIAAEDKKAAEYEAALKKKEEAIKKFLDENSSGTEVTSEGGTNKIGDRKTVGNIVYEWDGKNWKQVQSIDLTDEQIKKEIEKLEASYSQKQAVIKRNHLEGKTSEDQYNDDLLQAELEYLNSKLNLYKKGSKEYEETVNKALEKQVQVDRTIKDLLLKAEKELADARLQNMTDGLDKQEAFENQKWINEKTALENRLIDKKNLSDQEIAYNNLIYQIIEEGEVAHQERMTKIQESQNLKNLQDNVDAATPIDPNFVTLDQQQAFYDARLELINAQYEQEKKLAGENQSALLAAEQSYNKKLYDLTLEQIDADFALKEQKIATAQGYVSQLASIVDEESALGKALFIFNKGLAIAEVWVNIAKANAKAVAVSPLTGGLPWTAINTGVGVAQTAMIAAQTVGNFMKGKKAGGYTKSFQSDDQVVDYVHANEFVASAKAVRNPTIKPILDIIDMAQKTGTISTLNLPAILGAIGRSSGGYSSTNYNSTSNSVNTASSSQVKQSDPELLAAIKSLHEDLKKGGIKSKLVYREFEEFEEKVDTIRNNAQL